MKIQSIHYEMTNYNVKHDGKYVTGGSGGGIRSVKGISFQFEYLKHILKEERNELCW